MSRISTSGPTGWAPARALARVEGKKLLRSPLFLAGAAFVALGSAIFVRASLTDPAATWDDDGWTVAAATIFLAILTMVATNLAALRDRREDTEEQHASLPVAPSTRTVGLLVATAWPATVAAAMVLLVTAYAATRGPVTTLDNVHVASGLVAVLTLGALGLALAAWLPSPFVAPVVAWGLLLITPGEDSRAWHVLTPFAGMRDVELALWHIGYLLALAMLLGVAAVARTSRTRWLLLTGAVGSGGAIVFATILVMRACPGAGPCLL